MTLCNKGKNVPTEYTKDEAVSLKKKGFKKLNSLLESLLSTSNGNELDDKAGFKKVALISKWIYQYANYIEFETKFNPTRYINYKRGDIVFVNFGFGVGTEFGGNHYAVVLNNDVKHNSSNITVIPLSSYKGVGTVHERDVFLGNELYEKLALKSRTNIASLREQHSNNKVMLKLLKEKLSLSSPKSEDFDEITQLEELLRKNQNNIDREIMDMGRLINELDSLKEGSVAKIEQIRTISKMRIYNPRGKRDPLYKISFSVATMNKINDKLKELFVFEE